METSHFQRWLTAAIAMPLLILIIIKGGAFLFLALLCVVSGVAFSEWNKITDQRIYSIRKAKNLPFYLIPVLFIASCFSVPFYFLTVIALTAIIVFVSLRDFNETREHILGTLYILTGFIYTCVLLSFVARIRLLDNGITAVFLMIMAVFACDTGAFYAGRTFGKNKLMPKVSPKKTIEGFAGGFIFSVTVTFIFKLIFFKSLPALNAVLCGTAAGIMVPMGDLFESMIKRGFGIKDSGSILPGHGGILDRIDGLLFAAPVIYILILI